MDNDPRRDWAFGTVLDQSHAAYTNARYMFVKRLSFMPNNFVALVLWKDGRHDDRLITMGGSPDEPYGWVVVDA